jgi:hypothetical protein
LSIITSALKKLRNEIIMSKNLHLMHRITMVLMLAIVAACGGGGASDSAPAAADTPGSQVTPTATVTLTTPTTPTTPVVPTVPVAPIPTGDCQAATVTWVVAGKTCSATAGTTSKGTNAVATDLVGPDFGSASFSCTNGTLAANPVASLVPTCMKADIQAARMAGYLQVDRQAAPKEYNGGFSMYVAAWPLFNKYPGPKVQTGLPSTWMNAFLPEPKPIESYSTIEGGLGWWNDTVFGTETPKFHMGGVATNFSGVSNGPGIGRGDWSKFSRPSGKYGVAQLSSRLLWPPDGLNIKQGANGELLGYGYLPLPLTNIKATTGGQNIPTGDNSWTLFLNSGNFKGPAAFFMPYYWSRSAIEGLTNKDGSPKDTVGNLMDSRPVDADKALQMETQYVPAFQSNDSKGNTYARVAPIQFPRDANSDSVLINRALVFRKAALWPSVEAWFKSGGPVANSEIKVSESFEQAFNKGHGSSWAIYQDSIPKDKRVGVDWNSFAKTAVLNTSTMGFSWTPNLVSKTDVGTGSVSTLPEYYRLSKTAAGSPIWAVVQAKDVPAETGLASIEFKRAVRDKPAAFTTPIDDSSPANATSSWKVPGPAKNAGPFQVKLGDGTTVTYYWYLFKNQPTMLNADLTDAEREVVQQRVEKLHKEWTINKEYLPAPTAGKLADIDPALIVTPPKGFEIGYVPIATRQEQTP